MANNSEYIFDFLNDLWDLLPETDRLRFGETWKAYERTYGSIWMKQFELQLAANINTLPLYNVQRWLKHTFDSTTAVNRAATYQSIQDLSQGINLSNRYLIKFSVDGGVPVEIDLRGANASSTSLTEIVTRINLLFGQKIASPAVSNQLLALTSPTKGAGSSFTFYPASVPAKDASAIILGLDPDVDLPYAFPKYPYAYLLGDKFIAAIPILQNAIHDDQATSFLYDNSDYEVEFGTGVISFNQPPPSIMWAKDTLVNKETPYNNYGYLLGIYDNNTASYLKAVKGLWYAFWTGPRPENIRRSLYLLFGLPAASYAGTVQTVTDTTISVLYATGKLEVFNIPSELNSLVTAGQVVTQFEPLVDGIAVYDKVNYPGFVAREVGRFGVQTFLTENASRGENADTDETRALTLLEQNSYLPQINVNAFISQDIKLGNVKTFLNNIQPKSRTYLFQVLVGTFREQLEVLDEGYTAHATDKYPNGLPSLGLAINFNVNPNLDWNLNTAADQTSLDEVEYADHTDQVLDSESFFPGDRVEIDVYQNAVLTDSFSVEG